MTEIIVADDDEILKITTTDQVVEVEETAEELKVTSGESRIIVRDEETDVLVIDVADAQFISGSQPPDIFTPTSGQTVFTLSISPTATLILTLRVFLNGQKLTTGTYTIAGTQLTVTLPYTLETNDILEVYY